MRRAYNMKRTISMRQFIAEFGEEFSEAMKKRLLELGKRCVLTRKEDTFVLDLKHVEHTQYECAVTSEETCKKEYAYGEFIVNEGKLYFSEKCVENDNIMQSPIVGSIYKNLSDKDMYFENDKNGKLVNDNNIDYVIDNILKVCPPVSKAHMDIVREMIYHSER